MKVMQFKRLGNSGLQITQVSFGTALTIGTERKDDDYAFSLIDTAWNLGIRSFDVSNNYGMGEAERLTGKALARYPRQEYVISTKGSWPVGEGCYYKGLSRKHILWAFDESMKRIGLDYIDIYYAHRYDPNVSMEEIVRVFNYLIYTGRIRYWATSEWPVEALEECHRVCDKLGMEKPILDQFIYSFAVRKAETNGVFDFCQKNKVGMMGFSPLCQGFLTGKYRNGIPENSRIAKKDLLSYNKTINFYEQNKKRIDGFLSFCEKYHLKGAQVALMWNIRQHIYPVVGASKPEQLLDIFSTEFPVITEVMWKELETI